MTTIADADRAVLAAALRAPSAHNAQPWRVHVEAGYYALHYDHHDYLPADPDDRDAYLCMGAFCETLALAADAAGRRAEITPVLTRDGSDLHVADVRLHSGAHGDPLAPAVGLRATNRSRYLAEPVPAPLLRELDGLGCTVVPTGEVRRIVREASVLSWRDRRFVGDLRAWLHDDPHRPEGMSCDQLGLARYEWHALRVAFALGALPAPLARAFSGRDLRLLGEAPAVAVLAAASEDPADLVEAGRRLLRAWVTICRDGFAYHPISIAIDRPETRGAVAALLPGGGTPVAMFRIGRPSEPALPSNRISLADAVRPARLAAGA